jgi:hypothetical protein
MREDMDKVLVDSPRFGRAQARALAGSRRAQRRRLDPDGEGAAQRMGMRRDAVDRKHFGEHLGPLYRYLRRQVNRPWAKVYGELCAGLDRRSVVQAHLFEHLESRVAINTVWRDGEILVPFWGRFDTLAESWAELFVHPRTGILLPNRARLVTLQRRNQERAERAEQPHPERRIGLPGMAAGCQWHRVDGIWYEVRMASLDALGAEAAAYDVMLKRVVDGRQQALLRARYGSPALYAVAKRQLGSAVLRAHGLRSDAG